MSTTTKSSFSYYIHYIITAIIIFSGHFLPVIAPLTREGTVLMTSFIGAIYGWSLLNMIWPGLVAIISMGLNLGVATVVAAGFGNVMTWQVMFIFILVGLLREHKVIEAISTFFLTRQFTKGRPWVLINTLLITAFICGMLNGQGALIIYLTFVFTICSMLNIAPYSKFATTMGVGLCLACALAQIALPFKSTGLNFLVTWQGITGMEIDYVTFMMVSLPVSVYVIVMYSMIMRFIIRVDVTPLKEFEPDSVGLKFEGLSKEQKISLSVFAIAVILLLAPSVLPATWKAVALVKNLTVVGQVLVPILIFMVVRYDGKPIINFTQIASKYFPWELLVMMGVIMPLSSFLCADTTGVKDLMLAMIGPVVNLDVALFLLTLMGLTVLLTNFANNFVIGMIMMPVIYAFALSSGSLSANAAFMILVFCTHFACLTPGSTPFAATTFSKSDWIRQKEVFKYGIPLVVCLFLVTLPVTYFFAKLIL